MDRILRAVLLKWPEAKTGFDHYAVLIVYEKAGAWLYEKATDGVRPPREFDHDPHWQVVPAVVARGVSARLQSAMRNRGYDALLRTVSSSLATSSKEPITVHSRVLWGSSPFSLCSLVREREVND
jgi:hypothetical protein